MAADHMRFGVVMTDDERRVSVKQWKNWDGGPEQITIAIFVGDHRWVEVGIPPEDAAKVAELILSKPAVQEVLRRTSPDDDNLWKRGFGIGCRIAPDATLADYWQAPGEGPLHHAWTDKPHRLLYDLIGEVLHLRAERDALKESKG